MCGLVEIFKKENLQNLPTNLPVLIIAGEADPVGNKGKGVKKLYNMYVKQGMKDVKIKLYPNARHEILNEINRDEVMQDILAWLKNKRR